MPIYEYKCENGHVFDVMQKMSDDPVMECIECGAPVRKVLQPVGISFKGSGFYSTDYDNKKGLKSEPKETAITSSDSSNGASDSKGAAKGGAEKKPEKTSTGTANKGE